MRTITITLFCLLTKIACAQNMSTQKLNWSVNQLLDLNTNKSSGYNCTFATKGNDAISWTQKSYVTSLTVTGTSGTWTDVSKTGKVIYQVNWEGSAGTLTFERDTTGLWITIDIDQGSGSRLKQRFTVAQVN